MALATAWAPAAARPCEPVEAGRLSFSGRSRPAMSGNWFVNNKFAPQLTCR